MHILCKSRPCFILHLLGSAHRLYAEIQDQRHTNKVIQITRRRRGVMSMMDTLSCYCEGSGNHKDRGDCPDYNRTWKWFWKYWDPERFGCKNCWTGSPLLETLPPSLGELRNLKQLNLRDCKAMNCLPDSFRQLTQLGTRLSHKPTAKHWNFGIFASVVLSWLCHAEKHTGAGWAHKTH